MMKIAVSTATILLLLGTSALAQEQGKKRDDTLDKAGEIASQRSIAAAQSPKPAGTFVIHSLCGLPVLANHCCHADR